MFIIISLFLENVFLINYRKLFCFISVFGFFDNKMVYIFIGVDFIGDVCLF